MLFTRTMNRHSVLLLPLAAALASCASGPESGFTRSPKIYKLDPNELVDAADPSIRFEQRHYLHGAVSYEDQMARKGNYYTFFWRAPEQGPVKLKFDYLQAQTGFTVHSKEVQADAGDGEQKTSIEITGEEFRKLGTVLAWRCTLYQGGREIDTYKSANWEN